MQLFIVHRDSEVGEPLVRMVKDYTRHDCELVSTDATAMDWARRHRRCDLLLTQLEAEAIAVTGNKEEKAMQSRRQSA